MVKFGKKYRSEQITTWESKYINYKHLKHFIKIHSTNLNNDDNPINKTNITKQFVNELDREIKTFYLFFTSQERQLYVQINMQLHGKSSYYSHSPEEISNEIINIYKIASTTLNLTKYIHSNITAIFKILKKFDKKFNQFNVSLSHDYIVSNLKQKNSNLFYIFEFKLIDEVIVLLEDLQTEIGNAFKFIKKHFKKDKSKEKGSISLLNQTPICVIEKNINDKRRSIMDHISEIEHLYTQISQFHRKWNRLVKLSDYTNSNKTSNNIDEQNHIIHSDIDSFFSQGNRVASKITKENKINISLTLIQKVYMAICFTFILPNAYSTLIVDFVKQTSIYNSALIIAMTPLGGMFSILFTSFFISKTFKVPMLISSALCALGNILFTIGIALDNLALCCVARFLSGLSLNTRIHRSYILEFVPKKHISNYMLLFKMSNIIGYALGPFITYLFTFLGTKDKTNKYLNSWLLFDQYTVPSWILSLGAVILLILIAIFYVEPVNYTFNAYGDGESPSLAAQKLGLFTLEGVFTNEELNALNQLNDNLTNAEGSFQSNNTNLVTFTITNIVLKERSFGGTINKALSLVLYIVFISNFIIMSLLVNTPMYMYFSRLKEDKIPICTNVNKTVSLIMSIAFGLITFAYAIHFFYTSPFMNKSWYMLSISLFILIVEGILVFGTFIHFVYCKIALLILVLIFSYLLMDTSVYFYTKFVPSDFVFCKLNASTYILLMSMLGMFCGSIIGMLGLAIGSEVNDFRKLFKWVVISHLILVCVGVLAIVIIGLSFGDKAIRRIMRKKDTQKLRRTEF